MYVTLKQLQRKHESPQRSKTRCNLLQNTCVAPINKDTSKKCKGEDKLEPYLVLLSNDSFQGLFLRPTIRLFCVISKYACFKMTE